MLLITSEKGNKFFNLQEGRRGEEERVEKGVGRGYGGQRPFWGCRQSRCHLSPLWCVAAPTPDSDGEIDLQ